MKARIIFLALSAAVIVGAFALAGREDTGVAGDTAGGVTVAVATDLHYLAPELTDKGEYFTELVNDADGKVMLYIDELVRAFTDQIAAERPDALVLSGDLTFNGETLSHEALAAVLAGVEDAGVPVYVMPGNHDMNSSMAASFSGDGYEPADSPDEGEFAEIYADFGFSEAMSRDGKSLSYVAQLADGLRLIMLDVNTRSDPGYVLHGTFDWLEQQLEKARSEGQRVIAVSHQNIYPHNSFFTSGYIIGNGGTLHSLYEEYGVLCNLSGHIHLQHTYTDGVLPEIVTSSLAVNPNQYGVLSINGDSCEYRTESVRVSDWARGEGREEPELLDFAAYSESFFKDTAVRQALDELEGVENAGELAQFYADVNALYFAGRTELIEWDDALMDAWSGYGYFIPAYLQTIRADGAVDYTHMSWRHAG